MLFHSFELQSRIFFLALFLHYKLAAIQIEMKTKKENRKKFFFLSVILLGQYDAKSMVFALANVAIADGVCLCVCAVPCSIQKASSGVNSIRLIDHFV